MAVLQVDQLVYHLNVVDIERVEERIRAVEASLGLSGSQSVPVEYSRSSDSSSFFTKLLLGALLLALLVSLGSNMNINLKMDGFVRYP